VLRAGERVDAVPDTADLELDARVLPGQTLDVLLDELQAICGDDVTIEVTRVDEPPTNRVDSGLLPALAQALGVVDPGAVVVPMLNPGVTDGRFFAPLGIQHHGFLPMQLSDPVAIIQTMHGSNERVPTGALEFGTSVYETLLLTTR
jgi:acetylornithine deacetylase/succinyl-diaminopimelate desuccinylase-like protein